MHPSRVSLNSTRQLHNSILPSPSLHQFDQRNSIKRMIATKSLPLTDISSIEPCNDGESHVVICGGGIIGASLAYYLTKKGIKPIVIERTEVAAAASGKAGGFLAKKWGNGSTTQNLHQLSYRMHQELASELGIESWRTITTLGVSYGKKGSSSHATWLDGTATSRVIDTDTAQVTPHEYTTKVMQAAINQGARLVIGSVVGVDTSDGKSGGRSKQVSRVRVKVEKKDDQDGEGQGQQEYSISAKQVTVCLGPWSVLAEDWFHESLRVPIEGIKSTSIVFKDDEIKAKVNQHPFALFCTEHPGNGTNLEVYPRSDGSVYVCGIGGSDYVSGARLREGGDCEHQGLIQANPSRVQAAMDSLASITSVLKGKEPVLQQACMRPCAPDAIPIMGRVPNVEGAFISAGHNCWGILWAPISGLIMAELMVEGKSSTVDLSPFDPARFTDKGLRGGLPQNLQEDDERGRHSMDQPVGEQW